MRLGLIQVVLASSLVVGVLIQPIPEASAAVCVHRGIGHAASHGGQAVDDMYHLDRGELPTCANESADDNVHEYEDNTDEQKSRYCRHHIIC